MRPGVIDVHTHLPLAFGTQFNLNGLKLGLTEWSVDGALRVMDDNGVAAGVLSNPFVVSGPEAAARTRAINLRYAEIREQTGGRLGGFGALPMEDVEAAVVELRHVLDDLRLEGLCLPTSVGGRWLGHPDFEPLWREMDRRGAVAFVHPVHPINFDQTGMGYPVATLEFMFESTRMITNLVYSGTKRRFPNVKVISTHGGGAVPYLAQRISTLAGFLGVGDRVLMAPDEVLADLRTFYFDITACATPNALPALLELVPPSQLMMGFDWPMMPPGLIAPALDFIATTPALSDADRDMIRFGAARALFPNLA
ncbi:MAG: amidohydrolase [Alphaproteobacteria bacterium]|nr:amidohydrolase [Alphaproteobacteria bacterium]MBU1514329.1 amidohydrolase [Alphaproteobacteria bacterium]MBU2095973.1 amidohydrolase [Alphaproteobacteria bacterium]MBU2153071.1 amidohydrolase [Alphaproteobacteria bacterium]MBU2308528.1 amidohydrolase [Alphaproteobacteria bacterium]